MAGAESIRITDLARPEYSPAAKALLQMAGAVGPELSVAAIYQNAAAQLGDIECYEDPGLLERLGVLCAAVNDDTDLSPMGRVTILTMYSGYLVQRSRLEDLYRRHPDIDALEISRPIIVTGLPRSGTTHLLNLIAADTRLRSLPYWESLEPIPAPAEQNVAAGREDPRIQRCREQLLMREQIIPLFNAMHDMYPEHIHEEIELLAMDFSTVLFETLAQIPAWVSYYEAHDQTPHYLFLKRALKALQWLRGPSRWVLKSPQHMENLIALKNVFPDATYVLTHRDPAAVIASHVTMMAYSGRLSRDPVRPGVIAAGVIERMLVWLRKLVDTRDELPAQQSIDIMFHEFMAADIATIERIYALAQHPLTTPVRAAMQQYIAANPRGKHGQVIYDLKGDFGITESELRAQLDFYYQKFPVKIGA